MDPDYRKMVSEIAEVAADLLSAWECTFIESMQEWRGDYTDKQKDIIDRLYERVCDSPL